MRVKILAALIFFVAFSLGCATTSASSKAASLQLTSEGYMPLGKAKVWPLFDGEVTLKPVLFQGISAEEKLKVLNLEVEEDTLPTSLNAYFVEWGEHRILIDAGAGGFMGPSSGLVPAALEAKGIAPDSVDTVLVTHLHSDHFGGLLTEAGELRFPNATVWAHKADIEFWTSPGLVSSRPEEEREGYAQLREAALLFVRATGRKLKTFEAAQTILPGVQVVSAPGHTPGHTVFMFESDGQKLLFCGDLIHNIQLQAPFPKVHTLFDINAATAVSSRLSWMGKAAKEGFWIAGSHLPHPGIGRLEKLAPEKYRFLPIVKEP